MDKFFCQSRDELLLVQKSVKRKLLTSKKYRQSEKGKKQRREEVQRPENKTKRRERARKHREENRDLYRSYNTNEKGRARGRKYRETHPWQEEYKRNIEKYKAYYKRTYVYLKDTFTREKESCYKVEKLIDDKLHEWNIGHKFQVVFRNNKRRFVADWVLFVGGKKVIVEYFGVSVRLDKIGDLYRKNMKKKIAFYSELSDYEFVDIYPYDLKEKLKQIKKLIQN